MEGVLPLSANLDSIGPIAASVRCCAELDAILSGEGGPVPEALPLRGLRLAIPTTLALDAMDKHVSETFAAAVQRLKDAGALVDEIAIRSSPNWRASTPRAASRPPRPGPGTAT